MAAFEQGVQPVFEKSGAAHETFLEQYLDKTDAALGSYYRSLIFTGKGSMPTILESDAQVADYVGENQGSHRLRELGSQRARGKGDHGQVNRAEVSSRNFPPFTNSNQAARLQRVFPSRGSGEFSQSASHF